MLPGENTSRPYLVRCLVFLALFSLVCLVGADDSDVTEQQERTQSEYPQGISRLLFKHMRFRDLPEISESKDEEFDAPVFRSWSDRLSDPSENSVHSGFYRTARNPSSNQYRKRQQQELLVNNLAALLADGRGKNSGSTLRMPSLRFG